MRDLTDAQIAEAILRTDERVGLMANRLELIFNVITEIREEVRNNAIRLGRIEDQISQI
jgi:2,4-dienoyl-CoA reductase-like NADH-dependent reductase (Old Yellow Enzyme family)